MQADGMRVWKADGKLNIKCSGTYCFTENTPLETGELMTQKHEGDIIETTNPSTGKKTMTRIDKIIHGFTRSLTHLLIAGSTLSLTPAHALQTANGTWVEAQYLHAGDQLISPNCIVTIDDVCTEAVAPTPVISYELEGNLPYFVGNVPVLAAPSCYFLTIINQLSVAEYAALKNRLTLLKLTDVQKEAVFAKIVALGNTTDTKNFVNAFAADAEFARGIANDAELVDVWKGVKRLTNKRANVNFLKALRTVRATIAKHISGEVYFARKADGAWYKVELKGYHIEAPEIDLYPGFYGPLALPNPVNPNFPDIITVGTSSNPIQRGKAFVTDILDYINENMPYTAKIEVEIPIGSGNKYLKIGKDGKRTIEGRTSMFPKSWDLDKIIEEVAYVRSRLVLSDRILNSDGSLSNLYSKACSDGSFNIRMYLNNSADINNYDVIGGSAFPEVR